MGYKRAAFTTGLTLGSVVLAAVALGLGAASGNSDAASDVLSSTSSPTPSPSATLVITEPLAPVTPAPTATPGAEAVPAIPGAPAIPVPLPAPPVIDPMSAAYNSYTDPNRPDFVSESDKKTWLALQQVIRQCMADKGFEYLNWEWWMGGDPQPKNLSYDAGIAWIVGMYGDAYMNPTGNWEESGCSGYALHITGDTTH